MAIKISFLGDITCDRPMLAAAKRPDGSYDFTGSLTGIKELLQQSDYVVGNLETVFAGPQFGYNPGPITYNSPDALLDIIKDTGITMLTTANNHCLDCGSFGADRTIQQLENAGMDHTGTRHSQDSNNTGFLIREINGIRISFVSFCDSMNTQANGIMHDRKALDQVNLLRSCRKDAKTICKEAVKRFLPMAHIKRFRAERDRKNGIPLVRAIKDDFDIPQKDMAALERAIQLLKEARSQSDFVVACVHCGGQFNELPGRHSVQVYDLLEPYADAIIGNHPHVVQRMQTNQEKVRAYSLGSLNMSPSADYVSHENLPEYSILLNLYLDKQDDGTVHIEKTTFSILRAEEDKRAFVSVKPADKRYIANVERIFERFTGRKLTAWSEEHIV